MLHSPLEPLARRWLRLRNRFSKNPSSISIFDQIEQTQRVLVYMPGRVEQFGDALRTLESLMKKRPGWKFTVVTKAEMEGLVKDRIKARILSYTKDDLNLLGFPRGRLQNLVTKHSYDLALDFSLGFEVLCVKLFQLCQAPIRACLDHDSKSIFYNFSIRVNPVDSLFNRYQAIVKYLTLSVEGNQVDVPSTQNA